jgi:hypothetical protein
MICDDVTGALQCRPATGERPCGCKRVSMSSLWSRFFDATESRPLYHPIWLLKSPAIAPSPCRGRCDCHMAAARWRILGRRSFAGLPAGGTYTAISRKGSWLGARRLSAMIPIGSLAISLMVRVRSRIATATPYCCRCARVPLAVTLVGALLYFMRTPGPSAAERSRGPRLLLKRVSPKTMACTPCSDAV